MLLHSLWRWGAEELALAGVADAKWQAELLLRGIMDIPRAKFLTHPELEVTQDEVERFREAIRKRSLGTPVQHILGKQEFFGRQFVVTPNVLIPRPETEILIEEVLKQLSVTGSQYSGVNEVRVLDLCTGSGCIGVSIAAEVPEARVTLTDVSGPALKVAEENAVLAGVWQRCEFRQGDLFSAVVGQTFDLVVSNPPYIESGTIPTLSPEVLREPISALDGGPDGLEFYRRIAQDLSSHLSPGGLLAVEIGHGQGQAVMDILLEAGLQDISLIYDLAGLERVVSAKMRLLSTREQP